MKIKSSDCKLIIKNTYDFNGQIRVNVLKLTDCGDYIQVYVNNGKTSSGIDKYAQFRLYKYELNTLMDWLNDGE